jgi:hypothetical protein
LAALGFFVAFDFVEAVGSCFCLGFAFTLLAFFVDCLGFFHVAGFLVLVTVLFVLVVAASPCLILDFFLLSGLGLHGRADSPPGNPERPMAITHHTR